MVFFMWPRYQELGVSGENSGQLYDCHIVSLKRDIFGEKINNRFHTSTMQTQDKSHRIVHSRELYCALYFVFNVGEGNGARFSHDRVSECKELKERFS